MSNSHRNATRCHNTSGFNVRVKTLLSQLTEDKYEKFTHEIIGIKGLVMFTEEEQTYSGELTVNDDVCGYSNEYLTKLLEEQQNGYEIVFDIAYWKSMDRDPQITRRLRGVKINKVRVSSVAYGEGFRSCFYVDFTYTKLEYRKE